MPTIIAYVNLFTANQPIYYSTGEGVPQLITTVPVDMVGCTAAQLAYKYNADTVHLFGQENFLSHIADAVYDVCETKYSDKQIKVEVNK